MISSPIFFPPLPPFLVKFQNHDGSIDYYSYFSSLAEDSVHLKLFQELSCLQQIQQIGAFFPHPFQFDSFKENNYYDDNKVSKEYYFLFLEPLKFKLFFGIKSLLGFELIYTRL